MTALMLRWPVAWTRRWQPWLAGFIVAGTVVRAAEPKAIHLHLLARSVREAMAKFLAGFRDERAKQWPAPVALHMEDMAVCGWLTSSPTRSA